MGGFLFLIFTRAVFSAYRSVSSVKWKSMISMITIFIGSLAITATFTIGSNVDTYVDYLININGGPKVTAYNYSQSEIFSENDLKIYRGISSVKESFLSSESIVNFRYKDKALRFKTIPITKDNWTSHSLKILSGSMISPFKKGRVSLSVVLSEEAIKKLKMPLPVGKFVSVKMKGGGEIQLKIIGITKSDGYSFDQGTAYVPHEVFRDISGEKGLTQLSVVGSGANFMNWIENFSNTFLKKKFGENLWIYNPLSQFLEQKAQLSVFIEMGYVLGLLALVAGSIGATSVMIFNINLRRREIGLYKSMGFSSIIILIQFTLETVILSLLGGILGAVGGSILGYFMSQGMFPVAEVSVLGFFLGVLSALVTGTLFGLVPAFMASRVDPVKALQG